MKLISEFFGTSLQLILAFLSFYLIYLHRTSPLLVIALFSTHIFLVFLTKYDENNPGIILHFNRAFLGVIRVATPIACICYLITVILEAFTPAGIYLAEFSMFFVYLTIPWVIFAGHTPLGFYFAYSVIIVWTRQIFHRYYTIDPPFIVYIVIAVISLMAIGTWVSNFFTLMGTLKKKEDRGSLTEFFEKKVWYILAVQIIMGSLLIILEPKLMEAVLTLEF